MARSSAPPCAASHQHRGDLWRRMLKINRAHRPARGQGPITAAYRLVYDWLLWKAPRGLGILIPAKATIAKAAGVSLATVKRAIAALARWGLLTVTRRTLQGVVPFLVTGRLYGRRAEMTTSNAYSFPATVPEIRGAQADLVGDPLSTREGKQRDGLGRWVPAATVAMMTRLAEKWGLAGT